MDEQRICNVERDLARIEERMNTRKAEFTAEFARLAEDMAKRDAKSSARDADMAARGADLATMVATLDKNHTASIKLLASEMDKRFSESSAAASKRETRFILSTVGIVATATAMLGFLITAS